MVDTLSKYRNPAYRNLAYRSHRYKKDEDYSYTLGVFPTLELLDAKPDIVEKVVFSANADDNEGIKKIASICSKHRIPTEVNEKLIRILSPKENIFAIGIFKKYESRLVDNANTILLVNPATFGNVGTIIRTMLGFGVRNLSIISPAVDLFNPEVVRSSMGALFKINFEYFDNLNFYNEKYKSNLYYFALTGKELRKETVFKNPYTLVFGNEGAGLPLDLPMESTYKIPMSSEIDSFNLGISVGICLYQASLNK